MRVITERFRNDEGRIVISIDIMTLKENFVIHFEFFADVLIDLFRRK